MQMHTPPQQLHPHNQQQQQIQLLQLVHLLMHPNYRDQQQSVNRALDETRNNIRKATDEARKDIPRYTQAANQYQERTIEASREIADNILESQKEIVNSLQSSWVPTIERAYGAFWNYWTSSRRISDMYARTVSSIADNTIAATRLVNNTVFSNLDVFRTCIQNARDNLKEVSRIGVNTAKTFEQTSRDVEHNIPSTSYTAGSYRERQESQF